MDIKHRKVNIRVRITDKNNLPLANQEIGVHQTDHAFLFGCGAFDFIPYVTEGGESWKQITDSWLEIFNYGTLPFYWGRYEPEEGKPDRDTLMKTAQYLSGKGVRVKGHPLVQAITTWDFKDGAWLKAPSGYLREDNSRKPSFDMLKKLIKQEWWTDTTVRTDENGWAEVEAFKGKYRVTVGEAMTEVSFTDDKEALILVR